MKRGVRHDEPVERVARPAQVQGVRHHGQEVSFRLGKSQFARKVGQDSAGVFRNPAHLIVLEVKSDGSTTRDRGRTADEFLAAKLVPPAGVGAVSLADMEIAIAKGATGRVTTGG